MKILYIDYDDLNNPYASGGQANTTHELLTRVSGEHKITVITGNYPGAKTEKFSDLTYKRLGIGNLGFAVSLLSHWFLLPFYILLEQNKHDLIIECFTGPFTTSFTPLVAKKPLIAIPSFFDSDMLSKKYHIPLDYFRNKLIGKYKTFFVLTHELENRIKKYNPEAKYVLIPGGVQKDLLNIEKKQGKYILYLGRIDIFNKGLDLLMEAWGDINETLIIAGSGPQKEINALKKLINKNNLQNRVKFVGRLNGEQKLEYFSEAKLVVQPTRFETFGYVALEALAADKILVCFDIQGYKWIPDHNAIKASEISASALKQAIHKGLDAVNDANQIEGHNRNFAKLFDWDEIALKFNNQIIQAI